MVKISSVSHDNTGFVSRNLSIDESEPESQITLTTSSGNTGIFGPAL